MQMIYQAENKRCPGVSPEALSDVVLLDQHEVYHQQILRILFGKNIRLLAVIILVNTSFLLLLCSFMFKCYFVFKRN